MIKHDVVVKIQSSFFFQKTNINPENGAVVPVVCDQNFLFLFGVGGCGPNKYSMHFKVYFFLVRANRKNKFWCHIMKGNENRGAHFWMEYTCGKALFRKSN